MAVLGLRGTGQFGVDFRPTNYRELYTLLEPNGSAPLNALLAMAKSSATDDPKYNHFRDELPPRKLVGTAIEPIGETVIAVSASDDIPFCVPNTLLLNTRTNELMRVVSYNGTDVTVVRAVGSVATAATAVNDVFLIVGSAFEEGSAKPEAVSWDPTVEYNYTQIFKTGVAITGTMSETFIRTGSKEQEAVTKALKLHMADIERAFFFGQRAIENPNSAKPRRYTGGLMTAITNVVDAASGFATSNTITENEFDRVLIENLFAWGSKQKVLFGGARIMSNLQKIAKTRWQPSSVEGAYGVSMASYKTFAGELMVYMHPLFRQIGGAYDYTGVVLDLDQLGYKYMKNRDTKLERNVQTPGTDALEHFYQTECGVELLQSKPHAIIKNWQNA